MMPNFQQNAEVSACITQLDLMPLFAPGVDPFSHHA
jgi:hypothetical protein